MAQRNVISEITPDTAPSELTQDRPARPYFVRPRMSDSQEVHPVVRGTEEIGMSLGWICFFCGFLCHIPWLLGFLLSFVSENKNDKRVRCLNLTAFLVVSVIYITVWQMYD